MSSDKRRALAKETSHLPYLAGSEAERATRIRNEILEAVFDRFIKPDDQSFDLAAPSRLARAKQLWKRLLTEGRASYFLELNDSRYADWIETGEPVVLPCTSEEIESLNRALPALKGEKDAILLASEIRATLLKCSDTIEQQLLTKGVQAEKRLTVGRIRDILKKVTDPAWFIRRKPKGFARYENLLASWVEKKGT